MSRYKLMVIEDPHIPERTLEGKVNEAPYTWESTNPGDAEMYCGNCDFHLVTKTDITMLRNLFQDKWMRCPKCRAVNALV